MADYAGDPNVYPANVRLPDDGLYRNTTELSKAMIDLSDRTASIAARTSGVPGVRIKNEIDVSSGYSTNGWSFGKGNQIPYFTQDDNSGGILKYNISQLLRPFCNIIWLSASVILADGHGSWPVNFPTAQLVRYPRFGNDFSGSVEVIDTATLTNAIPLAQYNGICRTMQKSITPHLYNPEYLYLIYVVGESGNNSLPGMVLRSLNIEVAG